MNNFLSNKIKYLSFFSILMVVSVHSSYLENYNYKVNNFIQVLLSAQGLCRVAVPLFFAISGYLYFHNIENNICLIGRKMKKRVRTLLLPYLLANLVFASIFLLMHYIPQVDRFVNYKMVDEMKESTLGDILVILFVQPMGFHLWFLRDLILVVLCTPVLFYLLKYIPRITTILIFFYCFFVHSTTGFPYALTWFTIGACLSVTHTDLSFRNNSYSGSVCVVCLLWLLIDSVCIAVGVKVPFIIHFAGVVFGVTGVWLLYDYIIKQPSINIKYLNVAVQYTFFIYLFHEPGLNVLKKLPPAILGESQWVYLTCYLVVPWLMVVLAIWVGKQLKRFVPGIYSILVGGR
ncbi:acyltransferase family protein [Parabacteroides sp.]